MNDPAGKDLVFFDGRCGLCHAGVRFLVARDIDGSRFVYAPLHGPTFNRRLTAEQRAALPDSVVVLQHDGTLRVRADATFYLLRRLGGPWAAVGRIGALLPRVLADMAYVAMAKFRRTFGKPAGACPVPKGERHGRFLE